MSRAGKTLLGGAFAGGFLISVMLGIMSCADRELQGLRTPCIISTIISLGILGLFIWGTYRPSTAPDLLAQFGKGFLEREGVCFHLLPHVENGQAWLAVLFENRYANPAQVRLGLRPEGGLPTADGVLGSVTVPFTVEGGAFGVAWLPWALGAHVSGTHQRIRVSADVAFPLGQGPGKLLRFRDGVAVPAAQSSPMEALGEVASALVGTLTISSGPEVGVLWDAGVPRMVDPSAQIRTETLWSLQNLRPPQQAIETLTSRLAHQAEAPAGAPQITCEVCGADDATTVAYTMLVGLGPYFLFRRGEMHRHCRRHLLRRGLVAYFVTLLTGCLGISLALFPFAIYGSAMTLRPLLGWKARVMGILPGLALLGLIAYAVIRALMKL